MRNTPRDKYNSHKSGAKKRGVSFLLTFEEWWEIWQSSGHWHERGCQKGQYCMSRFNDIGPYEVSNVEIILHSENDSRGKIGNKNGLGYRHTKEAKKLISQGKIGNNWNVGRICSESTKLKISLKNRGKSRPSLSEQHKRNIAEGVRRARSGFRSDPGT